MLLLVDTGPGNAGLASGGMRARKRRAQLTREHLELSSRESFKWLARLDAVCCHRVLPLQPPHAFRTASSREGSGKASASAQINVHVGQDSADLRQLDYLPRVPRGLCVTRHSIEGHALGAGLKEKGILKTPFKRVLESQL